MQIHIHIVYAFLCATLLFSFSSLAQDAPKTEHTPAPVPEKETTEKPDLAQDAPEAEPAPAPEQETAETPEPQPEESLPAQDDATYEVPPNDQQAEGVDNSAANPPSDAKAKKKELPFAKGDMFADLSVALAGSGNDFYLGVGATYGYYIANRFSLGLYVQYTHIFSDDSYDYKAPESLMFLPFVQFTILRSASVSPYVFVTGGYEGKWTYNAKDGYASSPNGWLIGGGGGVYVGITKQVAINIRLLGAYKWYSDTQIYRYKDSDLYDNANETVGGTYKCNLDGQCNTADYFEGRTDPVYVYLTKTEDGDEIPTSYECYDEESCEQVYDRKDKKSEGLFPLITIGVTVFF